MWEPWCQAVAAILWKQQITPENRLDHIQSIVTGWEESPPPATISLIHSNTKLISIKGGKLEQISVKQDLQQLFLFHQRALSSHQTSSFTKPAPPSVASESN